MYFSNFIFDFLFITIGRISEFLLLEWLAHNCCWTRSIFLAFHYGHFDVFLPQVKYSAAFRNKIKDNTQLFIIYPLLSHLLCACLIPGIRWKRILCLSSFSLTFGFALIFIHSMVIYEISNSDCELTNSTIEFDHLDIDSLFDDDEIICESSFLFDKTRWIDIEICLDLLYSIYFRWRNKLEISYSSFDDWTWHFIHRFQCYHNC